MALESSGIKANISPLAECRNIIAGLLLFYGDVDLRAVVPPVQGDGLAEWYWEVCAWFFTEFFIVQAVYL